ncbi:MAG: hypothetical protein IT460_01640 [Planctomycetes bacterium]|nr:hypothetical protein [Planctomycetota bacterium]
MDPTDRADTPQQWIVVAGDVLTGLVFYGPFETEAAALDAQADYEGQHRRPTVVAPLSPP